MFWDNKPLTVMNRRSTLAVVVVASALFDIASAAAKDPTEPVIAWRFSKSATGATGRYLLPADSCYRMYRDLVGKGIERFPSAKTAEAAGYVRRPFAMPRLGKYVGVCSRLYDYFIQAACERVSFESDADAGTAGYVPVENFKAGLHTGPVVAIVGSGLYRTACDPDYECLLQLSRSTGSAEQSCRRLLPAGKTLRTFAAETAARDAGYIPIHEALYSELDEGPSQNR
jgi:hypothetical protein